MSSMAPRTTVPCATREAASVPALVIHSIIRPPWICPGPPACSGKTHSIISSVVSAIDGMWGGQHPSAGGAGGRRHGGRNVEDHRVETVDTARVEPEAFDVGARHGPL